MQVFVVCYDLKSPSTRYEELYKALDQLDSWRLQDSVFLVKSAGATPKDIYDRLIGHIDPQDQLMIFQIDQSAKHCGWDMGQWVKQRVSAARERTFVTGALDRPVEPR